LTTIRSHPRCELRTKNPYTKHIDTQRQHSLFSAPSYPFRLVGMQLLSHEGKNQKRWVTRVSDFPHLAKKKGTSSTNLLPLFHDRLFLTFLTFFFEQSHPTSLCILSLPSFGRMPGFSAQRDRERLLDDLSRRSENLMSSVVSSIVDIRHEKIRVR